MNTAWGELRVCDAHVHFFSRRYFSLLTSTPETAPRVPDGWDVPGEAAGLASQWDAQLARHGVERALLVASIPGDAVSVHTALADCPQRFAGGEMVNPAAPEFDASRVQLIPWLFPAMHRYSLHDERLTPLWEHVSAQPVPAAWVHCGVLSVGVRSKLGLPSHFDMRYSNPMDLHAIAMRYPGIRFVIPHFGAGYLREALMLCDLCPNVLLDTSSSNRWMRYEGLTLEGVFRRALDVAGAGRLLFGSDSSFFPRGWNAAVFHGQAEALARIGIGREAAAAIFGENFASLVKPA